MHMAIDRVQTAEELELFAKALAEAEGQDQLNPTPGTKGAIDDLKTDLHGLRQEQKEIRDQELDARTEVIRGKIARLIPVVQFKIPYTYGRMVPGTKAQDTDFVDE